MKVWNQESASKEVERITKFIEEFVLEEECIVVPVSGGIDSDIVARLCCRSVGNKRVRLFIVIQSEMEEKFLYNARSLAEELNVPLAEIHLENANKELIHSLEEGEPGELFHMNMMLDTAKAKCSVRSAVISCYQDKGFLIAGTTNRTEKELGFFLTFGDNLAHFKPIAHLYKSELNGLAQYLGTSEEVIEQEPSAGFWKGQTDKEDLAYWILNDGPIVFPRQFTEEEISEADRIKVLLNQETVDKVLELYSNGRSMIEIEAQAEELPAEIVRHLIHIVDKAKVLKNRTIMAEIQAEK